MRPPDPSRRLYWFCAGDILGCHPVKKAESISPDVAVRLHAFHRAEHGLALAAGALAACRFHAARERELRLALGALSKWRRAAGPSSGVLRA